ncbi:MAG: DUF1501 domain-containing protein [Phycisphaeraceae bacterium]
MSKISAHQDSLTRRDLFGWVGNGLGAAGLMSLLARDGIVYGAEESPGQPRPHFNPKAKRVIHICLIGGLSQIDSFDYKPLLARHHGKELNDGGKTPETFFGKVGLIRQNDWAFKQRGKSGLWVSDLFPHLGDVADELTVINSMVADSANHTPATFEQSTGFRLNGFPTMGAWVAYGLGNATDELPAYVVLPDPRGLPPGGTINWSNGFLPAQHQGVAFETKGPPISDLFPERTVAANTESASRDLLKRMNARHLREHGDSDALASRMHSYELAAKMQLAVPRVTALEGESPATREAYGLDSEETRDFGRNCLLARRLLEQGVRFVQLFSGGSFGSPRINWDGHEDMIRNHNREAKRIDQPVAALLKDLKQRGMLDDTLVLFTTEFGRTPFTQADKNTVGKGRDHNMYGFSLWMAGAGLKGGTAYGQTDEVGWKTIDKAVHWYDFHATMLHLLGIDHEKLTWYHNGIMRRLTNVHGHAVKDILA